MSPKPSPELEIKRAQRRARIRQLEQDPSLEHREKNLRRIQRLIDRLKRALDQTIELHINSEAKAKSQKAREALQSVEKAHQDAMNAAQTHDSEAYRIRLEEEKNGEKVPREVPEPNAESVEQIYQAFRKQHANQWKQRKPIRPANQSTPAQLMDQMMAWMHFANLHQRGIPEQVSNFPAWFRTSAERVYGNDNKQGIDRARAAYCQFLASKAGPK